MKKLIKQIICTFMVFVAIVGLTTDRVNAQPFLNPNSVFQVTNTNVISQECNVDNSDKLYPNFENIHTFYSCTPYGLVLMQCPADFVFDVEANRCEYPSSLPDDEVKAHDDSK